MKTRRESFDAIGSQAAAWLARCDGGMSITEKNEFEKWCAADPRHAVAARETAAVWKALDHPVATGRVESLRAELRTLDRRHRRRWIAGSTVALAAAACLAVVFVLQRPTAHTPESIATATARVIEPERQTLPDGSIVDLKRGAKIAVAFTPELRTVILEKGEAHFSVTKNPNRPFIVDTGAVSVRAVGTTFAVGLGQSEVEVLVTEGRVRVSAIAPAPQVTEQAGPVTGSTATMVEANQRTVVSLGATVSVPAAVAITAAELNERLSWRLPWLEFSETSLADAIAMFNTYNRQQLQTTDKAVAAMRVTGMFRSDNVEGFVRALESSLGLQAEHGDAGIRLYRTP